MSIKRFFKWPVEKFVAWRYIKAGLEFGGACSYVHVFGKPIFFGYKKKNINSGKLCMKNLVMRLYLKTALNLWGEVGENTMKLKKRCGN